MHKPERTCIICRKKGNKEDFLRIAVSKNKYVFDKNQKKQSRGYYCCKDVSCLSRLRQHKMIKLENEELLSMLSEVNKASKNILNILRSMKNSKELVFGMNMTLEEIKRVNFIVIATDISKKNKTKIMEKIEEFKIPHINLSTKYDLGSIFDKDEINVIGIKDKKMARGLIQRRSDEG